MVLGNRVFSFLLTVVTLQQAGYPRVNVEPSSYKSCIDCAVELERAGPGLLLAPFLIQALLKVSLLHLRPTVWSTQVCALLEITDKMMNRYLELALTTPLNDLKH